MDAVRDQRGQALVFSVVVLGLAAVCVIGLHGAAERLLSAARDDRAGEAAAAAAGAAVADLRAQREVALGRDLERSEIAALAASPEALEAARAAATRVARANGRYAPAEVGIHAFGLEIEVHVAVGGHRHIALLVASP